MFMTEEEWLASDDPGPMLEHLEERNLFRKHKLMAVACCRRMDHLIAVLPSRWARLVEHRIGSLEISADNPAEAGDPFEIGELAGSVEQIGENLSPALRWVSEIEAALSRRSGNFMGEEAAVVCARNLGKNLELDVPLFREERRAQSLLVRDIFGNPFRPVAINPDWLAWHDGTLVKLARRIYDDRRWDLMPILADALEDAGCDNPDLPQHCRGPGPHVRGCWVVDLLLGKA